MNTPTLLLLLAAIPAAHLYARWWRTHDALKQKQRDCAHTWDNEDGVDVQWGPYRARRCLLCGTQQNYGPPDYTWR